MSYRSDLRDAIRRRWEAMDSIALAAAPILVDLTDEIIRQMVEGGALDAELLEDAQFMEQLRKEVYLDVAREALGAEFTLARNLDNFQAQRNQDMEDTEPAGYVLLGPDDSLERPFCDVLNGHWLTREEIDQLNNQQIGNVFVTRGGYNCRHGWYALYGDEVEDFPRGSVSRANAAAVR